MASLNDTKLAPNDNIPRWYSPSTGICRSTHQPIPLPQNPNLDVVSHLFSRQNDAVSPSAPALVDALSGAAVSLADLRRRVDSLAAAIRQNDVVLLLLPNSVHFPAVFLAALRAGATVTAASPLSSDAEIRKLAGGARVAFATHARAALLRELGLKTIVVPESAVVDSESEFYRLISSGERTPWPVIRQSDTAAIMYSSGTTGESKGVVLTHGNLIAMVELFVRFEASQYSAPASEAVHLAVLPMFHIYGLSLFALGLLSLGSTIVVMSRKFDIDGVADAVERFGVTHFPVVPPILAALSRNDDDRWRRKLRSLKQVSTGAAPLSGKAIQDFVRAFPNVDFIQGYGMTETTAVGTRGFNTERLRNFASIGLLAPNMEAKVVDWNTGSFLPPGIAGELWLRGPAIMKVKFAYKTSRESLGLALEGKTGVIVIYQLSIRESHLHGYLNNKAETMETINKDGWLRTGDIAYFDNDGYLYVVDRLKEIIKYNGFQIGPADLEAVLVTHPEVVDVAVAGVADEDSGEIPVAFVVRKNGSSLSEETVVDYVAKQVAPYKKIRKVVFTSSIPRSAAGKILRRELRRSLSSKL